MIHSSAKKYNNLKGPEYTEDISNIFMIKYEGGSKDIFNQNSRRNKKELGSRTIKINI